MIILPSVPMFAGTSEEQLAQMQKYLRELEEALQLNLNAINYTSFDEETQKKLGGT